MIKKQTTMEPILKPGYNVKVGKLSGWLIDYGLPVNLCLTIQYEQKVYLSPSKEV